MLELNKIYEMDCLEGMKKLDDNSVQAVWTDPPYNIGYNYNEYIDKKENYFEWCRKWIKESFRILKLDGSIFIKMWSFNMPKICNILEEEGFILKNIIIWKRKSSAGYKDRFLGGYETIIFFSKSKENKFYPDRIINKTEFTSRWDKKKEYKGRLHDLWTDIKPIYSGSLKSSEGLYKEGTGEKLHPTQHPQELVRRCILSSTDEDDLILDLFAGSGTVLIESKLQKRNFIGFEISKEYCNIIKKRLEQENLTKFA